MDTCTYERGRELIAQAKKELGEHASTFKLLLDIQAGLGELFWSGEYWAKFSNLRLFYPISLEGMTPFSLFNNLQ